MIDPDLVDQNALSGVDVGVSVSDSADLARLGLHPRHLELCIGEVARAVLLAGGTLTYGGRISPSGMTQQLMSEVRRYGTADHALTLVLAWSEHRKLSLQALSEADAQLGTWGRLTTLDVDGKEIDWRSNRGDDGTEVEQWERQHGLSALRRHMTDVTNARVVVGGQLRNYQGAMPGVLEEIFFALHAGKPLYLAGGFGGAACAAGRALGVGIFEWLPTDMPEGSTDDLVVAKLEELSSEAVARHWTATSNGLSDQQNADLSGSHRPGDVASLVVLGAAAAFNTPGQSQR